MNINSISHSSHPAAYGRANHAANAPNGKAPKTTDNIAVPQTETPVPDDVDDVESVDTQEKGVLRKLAEGHFSPVADIRLRINFYDELAQTADGSLNADVTALDEKLMGDVSSILEGVDGSDQDDVVEIIDALTQALPSAQQGGENLLEATQTAITDFMTAIQEAFAPPPPAPPADPPDGPVAAAEESVDQPEWVTSLQETLDGYLADLASVFADSQDGMAIVPVEGVPGSAYAKFLAIYESLGSADPVQDEDPEGETVDVIA